MNKKNRPIKEILEDVIFALLEGAEDSEEAGYETRAQSMRNLAKELRVKIKQIK